MMRQRSATRDGQRPRFRVALVKCSLYFNAQVVQMPVKTILSVSAIVLLTSCSDSANPDTSDGSTEQLKTSYSTHKAACDDLQQKKTCQGTPCDETWLDEAGTVAEFASCLCDWLEVYGCAEWAKPPTTPSICHDKLLTESGSYAPVTASCFVTGP